MKKINDGSILSIILAYGENNPEFTLDYSLGRQFLKKIFNWIGVRQ